MTIAIAKAYNGIHRDFNYHLKQLGVKTFYFNIDNPDWLKVIDKKADAYLWLADQKEERYREIHDRIYFIEHILQRPIFPDMQMYFAEGDKIKQWQIYQQLGISTPKTYITQYEQRALKIIDKIKYPFVLKDPYGYGGLHVFKIENKTMAKKYVKKIFSMGLKTYYSTCKDIFYAQEFIATDRDLRVITIGSKVFCAYWRISKENNWKHNLEQGATVNFSNIPSQALKLCESISKKMKFHWMGYDLLVTKKGNIKMIEHSCCVRVKGATQGGYDVRQAQMKYIKKLLSK